MVRGFNSPSCAIPTCTCAALGLPLLVQAETPVQGQLSLVVGQFLTRT